MAHFAKLDENNEVTQVIVVNNSDILDENGNESEAVGVAFCENLLGGKWIQTSYNARFRKNYAGIGFTYDETLDAFIPPCPIEGWVLDEETCQWVAPVPYPNDGQDYVWNSKTLSWDLYTSTEI